jgi:hypothetical protein
MTEEDQKKLLELAKKALTIISVVRNKKNRDFVFELRDLIRKIEAENNDRR